MNKTITQHQEDIIQEFSHHTNWFDTYHHLITLGKTLPPLDTTLKTPENTIGGCQSTVWLTAHTQHNTIHYHADSNSAIIKGILSLILRVVNNQPPEDIIQTELYFIKKIGLSSHLSPSRTNGLLSIIKQIKTHAQNTI